MKTLKFPSKKVRIRLLKIVGSVYVLYLIFGFLAVPRILRNVLEERVTGELSRVISLEEASFNPFTLSVELIGLRVEDDQSEDFVEIGRLFANSQIFPILFRRVSVKEFALSDTVIRLKVAKDGSTNIDRLLETPAEEEEAEPSKPFHFTIGAIDVANFRLEFADHTRTLSLEETIGPVSFVANDLRSDPESDSPYNFSAKLGETTAIDWSGDVSVNPIASKGSFSIENLDISKAKPFWHDLVRAEIAGAVSVSGSYGVELSAETEAAFWSGGSIEVSAFSFDDPEEDTKATFESLLIDGIEAHWPDNRLVVESVTLEKPVGLVTRDEEGAMCTPIREVSDAAGAAVSQTASSEPGEEAAVDLDVLIKRFTLNSGTVEVIDRAISNEPELSLSDLSMEATNVAPFNDSETANLETLFLINGSGATELNAEVNIPKQTVEGTLSLDAFDLATLQGYVALYSNAEFARGSLTLDVEYDADITSESFAVNADMKIDAIDVRELGGGGPVFSAASISVVNAAFADETLEVERFEIDRPITTIAMTEEGLNLSRLAKEEPSDESEESEKTETAEAEVAEVPELPLELTIHKVAILDGRTDFIDSTLLPAYQSSVTGFELAADEVSSKSGEKAKVSINGTFDRGGSFSFSGDLEPLDFKNYANLKFGIDSFDLSATAPYWKKYLGRNLDKGILNVDSSFGIQKSILDGSNDILVDHLTLGEKVQSDDSLGLPIGLAVAILKDRQGRMELPPLKLSGDLDDPSISVAGIVMKALGNIIVKIATSPFAILGGLAGGGDDLDKASFLGGAFELDESMKSRLDKIAKILEERPGLKVDLSSVIAEKAEAVVFKRVLISNRLRSEDGGQISDPIVLLRNFDKATYEASAKNVYRDLLGIELAPVDETDSVASELPASQPGEVEVEPSEEPVKRNVFGAVAKLIKNVTGQGKKKVPEQAEPEEPESEPISEQAEIEEPVVELPSMEEIEKRLFAEESFQVDASWLERLANERAKNIKDYLTQTKGIDSSRVFISGDMEMNANAKTSLLKFNLTD